MSRTGRVGLEERAAASRAWSPPRVPGWWLAFRVLALLSVLAIYPLIFVAQNMRTLTVGLATLQGQDTTPIPLPAAGLLISLGPVLLVFLFSQRNLSRGLTAGAVK